MALYKSLGFTTTGGIHQHQGAAFSVPIVSLRRGERVRPMGAGDEAAIVELDRLATGLQRGELFAELLKNVQGVILDRGGEAVGFALFRRFGMGYSVGPVVAPDAHGAKVLISHWLGSNAGMFTRLDVPYDSGLSAWLEGSLAFRTSDGSPPWCARRAAGPGAVRLRPSPSPARRSDDLLEDHNPRSPEPQEPRPVRGARLHRPVGLDGRRLGRDPVRRRSRHRLADRRGAGLRRERHARGHRSSPAAAFGPWKARPAGERRRDPGALAWVGSSTTPPTLPTS